MSQNNEPEAHSTDAYSALQSALPGKVFGPQDKEFTVASGHYDSLQEQALQPACIVLPTSASDISKTIQFLAKHPNIPFAVTSGGCMPNSGAANIDGGVTINLQKLKQIEPRKNHKVCSVGPGARWGEVFEALDPLEISIMGGRVANVGVGGLTLGGGISMFSGQRGFVCDNVLNFEVVLASGTIVNANAVENPTLWLALRGGSNNFGIVTRLDFPTFAQGKLYGGWVSSGEASLDSQLQAFARLVGDYDPHVMILLIVSRSTKSGKCTVNTGITQTQGDEESPSLKPFIHAKPLYRSNMRSASLAEFAKENKTIFKSNARLLGVSTTFRNSYSTIKLIYQVWKDSFDSVKHIEGISWPFSIQPFVWHLSGVKSAAQSNVLGLRESDGPLVLFMLMTTWSKADDDEEVARAAEKLISRIDAVTKEAGMYHGFKYLNYAADWQDPIRSYGDDNLRTLRSASKQFDPAGMFQNQCTGGFKLWRTKNQHL